MKTKIIRTDELNSRHRNRMFQIMNFYYDHMHRAQFEMDLSEKTHIILLLDEHAVIQGFSTLLQQKINVHGRVSIALFSGDTVLDREHWGNGALGTAFGRYLTRVKLRNLFTPTYWFLISKGYKTYLLMTNNFPCHYPRFEKKTPERFRQLLNHFYGERFGSIYHPETDQVLPGSVSCALKVSVADIDYSLMAHPRIRFFVEKNVGWRSGEELACIAKVNLWVPIRYFLKRIPKNFVRYFLNSKLKTSRANKDFA